MTCFRSDTVQRQACHSVFQLDARIVVWVRCSVAVPHEDLADSFAAFAKLRLGDHDKTFFLALSALPNLAASATEPIDALAIALQLEHQLVKLG